MKHVIRWTNPEQDIYIEHAHIEQQRGNSDVSAKETTMYKSNASMFNIKSRSETNVETTGLHARLHFAIHNMYSSPELLAGDARVARIPHGVRRPPFVNAVGP